MRPDEASPPLVSVVLTAHNEAARIGATLAALARQPAVTEGRAEIILVDDRSTDATVERASAAGGPGLVLLHTAPDPGSALTTRQQALDLGFRQARGRVILTLDADSTVPPDWIDAMSAPILDGRRDALAGPIGFLPRRSWLAAWQSCDAAYYHVVCGVLAGLGLPAGVFFGNFGFRRALYAEVGGFDAIGFALTEDLAFAQALARAGTRIGYTGRATRVDVAACPSLPALVVRTQRVTAGPMSVLAVVLTFWPLTLVALAIAAAAGVGVLDLLALRFVLGGLLVGGALRRNPSAGCLAMAPLYELGAIGLAILTMGRSVRGKRIAWGGQHYGR